MNEYEQMMERKRKTEADARKRIDDWFKSHPDRKCTDSVFYRLAGGHFIYNIEKNEYGIYLMRTDTGGLVDLMQYGEDVLTGISYLLK